MFGTAKVKTGAVVIATLAAMVLAQAVTADVSVSIGGSWGEYSRSGSSITIGSVPDCCDFPRGYLYPYGSGYRFYYRAPYYRDYPDRQHPYYGPYYDPYQRQYPDWPDPRYQRPYEGYQVPLGPYGPRR